MLDTINGIAKKVFGSSNERKLRGHHPRVQRINLLEPEYEALSDEELRAKSVELMERVRGAISAEPDPTKRKAVQDAVLDDVLEEAFACVREAAKRTLGQRHYDVQLIGGMVLHGGDIAEMKTGEGKTLVATLPVFLNALTGRGVHVVTVNDYLAKRDSAWMGQVYKFLGMTVGCIVHGLNDLERREQYACDVTYGTNNEFGFDYLRDNMKYSLAEMCQRGHHFAIVDEVDSILVDEARTPLIISGPTDDRSDFYRTIDEVIRSLVAEHEASEEVEYYDIDEKQRSVALTEDGSERIEAMLAERELLEGDSLYDIGNVSAVHHVNQALRAHKIFNRDTDYIVRGDKVVLVDEFTGRMMEGRRLSEGLHQAIEAKEGVEVQPENVTLASITFQNFFRLYEKLAGMTGTAATEASEFADIYGLEVMEVPTNRNIARLDEEDEIYRTGDEKYEAIAMEIADAYARGQPVLVGTVSIEKSEIISRLLSDRKAIRDIGARISERAEALKDNQEGFDKDKMERAGKLLQDLAKAAKNNAPPVPHAVLNARHHEKEAQIIADAGVPGAVTIATNMAGRGTDIQLGGNLEMRVSAWVEERTAAGQPPDEAAIKAEQAKIAAEIDRKKQDALDAGGLYVIASERHESRRIDNQLRGRTGRQGDPGRSKFFVSVEDDLMRIFAPERMNAIMKTLGMKEGEAIAHPWMSKALETAQKRVEQRNFDVRKNLLKYDDVINDQRKAIFEQRIDFMRAEDVRDVVADMRHELVDDMVSRFVPPRAYPEQWDIQGLAAEVEEVLNIKPPLADWAAEEGIADEELRERLTEAADAAYAAKVTQVSPDIMRRAEKLFLLQNIDTQWREHLQQLDHLRSVVHLRGYAQRDPLNEFKTEAFALFERLLADLRASVTSVLMRVQVQQAPPSQPTPPPNTVETHMDPVTGRNEMASERPIGGAAPVRVAPLGSARARDPNDPTTWGRVGRNELCPCGSGKKYKHCHGLVTTANA